MALVLLVLAIGLVAGAFASPYRIRFTPKTAAAAATATVVFVLVLLWVVVLAAQGLGPRPAPPPRAADHREWAQWRRRGLRSLIVGSDGRASTSKTQAALWTLVVLFALIYLAFVGHSPNCPPSGGPDGLWNSTCEASRPPIPRGTDFFGGAFPGDLVVLLFSYAGAIVVKNDTERTVRRSGDASRQKELTDKEKEEDGNAIRTAGYVFTNDKGELDLLDTQYMLFTLFAIAFVLYQLIAVTKTSFPPLGGGLLALLGTSTTSYTVKKYLENKRLTDT